MGGAITSLLEQEVRDKSGTFPSVHLKLGAQFAVVFRNAPRYLLAFLGVEYFFLIIAAKFHLQKLHGSHSTTKQGV